MLSYNSDLQEIYDRLDNLDKLLAEMREDVAKSEERHRLFLKRLDRVVIDTASKGAMT